ncbi:heat shock 70 kDa protein 12A-like [Mercenaria mercenaria]|uniref:heat shock 70 kDa protein 12A-like n=1 Tax=Mercenaria mercenaria TaxID=6596 RepID=UPI00234E78CF|nr:heat shock 70 kDa protein 12A-like [Mercenaria mercenaria]
MGTQSNDYLTVAAIDFGTAYSGYAFSTRSDYLKDPLKVCAHPWAAGTLMSLKTSTCVLFDKNKKFCSFGFEAEDHYSSFALDNKHKDYYFFRRFKMKLFDKLHLKRKFMLEDEMGRKMPAMDVFSACIKYLKDHLMNKCLQQIPDVTDDDIRWVLTVPAIWNDSSKQFMREAADKAGIMDKHLMIALEPEAASLCCRHLQVNIIGGCSIGFVPFAPGSKYLVFDAGGGTVDITVHEVQASGSLKELYKANGGNWGGTYIDIAFRNLLADIVGNDVMDDFQATQMMDYIDLFREFEGKKRTFKNDMTQKIHFKVPLALNEEFKKRKGKDIKEQIETKPKYNKSITLIGDKLRMEAHIAKGLFEEACGSVAKHLKTLFAEGQVHDVPTILMVGGFSESPMLQDVIRKTMPDKRIIIPAEPGLAVLKGAVIFGHDPSVIQERRCRYTYGVKTSVPFKAEVHPEAKKFVDDDGDVLCADVFDRHVKIGQPVEYGMSQVTKSYVPTSKDTKAMVFSFYSSDQAEPTFVTDQSSTLVGKLTVDIGGSGTDRSVSVQMTFSETELKVEAVEQQTGKKTKAKFDFLGIIIPFRNKNTYGFSRERPMGTLNEDYLLVAAIDFGTAYSGYAFSTRGDYNRDPLKVSANTWGAGNLMSLKTSTCVLFDKNKKFHSFGFEAEDNYSGYALDDEHHDYYFFRRFKMKLFDRMQLKRKFMLEDEMGKKMSAMDVFSACIKYLKDHLMKRCLQQLPDTTDTDIRWVLTVPAIWNDTSKQFMREAAQLAGIESDHLLIALEPEAASLCCRHLPMNTLKGCSGGFIPFGPRSKYLVFDAGGGTVDITVHEVQPSGSLKELYKANGGNWGGTYIDIAFRNLLADIVGNDVMDDFQATQMMDYIDLFREFEVKKRNFKNEMTEKITFKVPIALNDNFKKKRSKDIKDHIKTKPQYDQKVNWIGDKLRMEASVAKGLFKDACDSVAQHLKSLFSEGQVKDVQTILMVGGFSESPMLQAVLRNSFPDKKIIIPADPGLAVLKGAVIFGHDPAVIRERRCKVTYGVQTSYPFKKGTHPESKKFTDDAGEECCADMFDKHVENGQAVVCGESQVTRSYVPTKINQKKITFSVYASKDPDPVYTTDPNCTHLGSLTVDLQGSGLDRSVKVQMTFGDTELHVTAIEEDTQKKSKAKFDFLS